MNATSMLIGLLCLSFGEAPGVTLRGTVQDKEGKAVANARVYIATAAPRVGPGLFCPSCYRDCAKWTRSDDQGRFEIRNLDPTLKFTVLATSPGKKSQMTKLLDPLQDQTKIVLEVLPADLPHEQTVIGEIVDDRGQALPFALIVPVGAQTAESRWWGAVRGVDATVSDTKGRFRLLLPEGYQGVDLQVTAHGYAGTTLSLLKPGRDPHRIVVPAGTRVAGRLVHAGKPMASLRIAVVQMERDAGRHFIKAVGAVTDKAGKFDFDHLPANEDYAIFTLIGEGPQKFVVSTKRFKAKGDRQERDLGDLQAVPAMRIAGRVELPEGAKLPRNAKIVLGRDPAWDLIAIPVSAEGEFAIDGLPPETYEVQIAAKGLHIHATRLPYQALGRESFGLRLRESIENLSIPLTRSQRATDQP